MSELLQSTPEQNTWHVGTIETGPLGAEALSGREVLAEHLKPVIEGAFSKQFGFKYGEGATHFWERGDHATDLTVEFLTDTIHMVTESDKSDVEKRETVNSLLDIVVDGKYRGRTFDLGIYGYGSRKDDNVNKITMFGKRSGEAKEKLDRRIGLARLFLLNPDMARSLMDSHTIGMHGTRSGALDSILERGLLPASDVAKQGAQLVSGERIYNGEGQTTVSLIDWHRADWLSAYAGKEEPLTTESLDAGINRIQDTLTHGSEKDPRMSGLRAKRESLIKTKEILTSSAVPQDQKQRITDNYPIIVAVDESALFKDELPIIPNGDVTGEFMVDHDIPKDSISMLIVPADRVEEVGKLCADKGLSKVKLYDMETYRQAFSRR